MALTQEQIYNAFGLSPAETSENNPDTADPGTEAQVLDQAGENVTDTAEPSEGSTTVETDTQPTEVTEDDSSGQQSEEERRANAARRRQQEQQQAIDNAIRQERERLNAEHRQQLTEMFESAGLSNPFTNQPIRSFDDFQEWKRAQDDARIQEELKKGKLSEETLNELISRNPTVQQAQRLIAQQQQADEEVRNRQFAGEVETQLAEIRKSDPTVKTVADLMNKPYSSELYRAVQRGNNFLDAFYLATRNQAIAQASAAASARAMNNTQNKNHMQRTSFGGKTGATVTEEQKKWYKVFNPKATDDDIQKFQNKLKN